MQFRALFCALGLITPFGAIASAEPASFDVQRCVNLGNDLDAPATGEWGHIIEETSLQHIADAGFDTVRLPVRWNLQAGGAPDFIIPESYFDRVTEVIDWALARDLNLILDVHHFEQLMEDPEANRAAFLKIWEQIANRYKDLPPSVMFEVVNEPTGAFQGDIMRAYITEAIGSIRRSNPDRLLIIGGDHWNSINTLDTIPQIDDPNIVHTYHYYHPFEFTHQKTSWTELENSPTAYWGSDEDRAQLIAEIDGSLAHREATGRALFVGEFGAYEEAPYRDMIDYLKASREAFEAADLGWCVWNFTSSFSIFDTDTEAWLPDRLWALGLSNEGPSEQYLSYAGLAESLVPKPAPILPSLDDEFNAVRRLLPKDGDLLHPPYPGDLNSYGKLKASAIEDAEMPGGEALQVKVSRAGKNPWDAGVSGAIAGAISKGDAIVVVTYVKSKDDGAFIADAGLQQNSEPYDAVFSEGINVSPSLKRVFISGIAERDYAAGEAGYFFQMAGQKQTLFLGPVFIFNLGQGVDVNTLP